MLLSLRAVLIIFAICSTFGCTNLGPRVISKDRIDYNQTLLLSDAKQILFNIVRSRYLESNYFLKISNITGQYALGVNTGSRGNWFFDNLGYHTQTYQGELGVGYRDAPTISYIPLESSGFVKLVLQPITLNELYLMSYGDTKEISALMRLVIKRMGNVINIGDASFPDSTTIPHYTEFSHLIYLVRSLRLKNQVGFYYVKKDKHYSLYFTPDGVYTPEAREIRQLLRISGTPQEIILTEEFPPTQKNAVFIQTRSVLGIISMLSHSVLVPDEHKRKGLVEITRDKDLREFDWSRIMCSMMTIYSSKEAPSNAYVSIYYQGYFFFVKNSDRRSKLTLAIIQQFISMKGTYESSGPQLTLPLN
ncbi:hypothetical protein [Legionella hackeliae]|uniref:Uncharacterized protein n=1 Tax=Legionella hackeliae TaxID=449 RepID=A0A0A8UPD9_LEGHA|nr:hypothetical protein [Legionella hackeliae]KTD11438.1 hypothetical protein Lhac_1834 [Legionella hackeliae]CEK10730.1 protein of unknown function [Legionella hackeliae]STX47480.1 Uncharacterised protein [Legionella hackeliae]